MIKENQKLLNKINAFSDIILLFFSMALSYFIRFYIVSPDTVYIKLNVYMQFSLLLVPINLLLYTFFNLYDPIRTSRFIKESVNLIKCIS